MRRSVCALTLLVVCAASVSLAAEARPAHGASAQAEGEIRVEPAARADVHAAAEAIVAEMSVRERAAAIVMGHIPTTDAAALRTYMADSGIGGFILMGANIPESEAALRRLTEALTVDAALPPLIAIDQEGGDVSRLPWDAFAGPRELQDAPPEAAERAYAARAALVQRAGAAVNFGIVADVTDDPSMFISRRVLGATRDDAAERVAAAVRGETGSVLSTLKHFPGHGAAPGDSHAGIPTTALPLTTWRERDAVPFVSGIDAGAELLMFGHLAYAAVDDAPATLSASWHRLAREELGFAGVAITDDLGMLETSGSSDYADPVANAVAAVEAGNDMVLTVLRSTAQTAPRIVDGLVGAVERRELAEERLTEAAERVIALRLRIAADGRGMMPCDAGAG